MIARLSLISLALSIAILAFTNGEASTSAQGPGGKEIQNKIGMQLIYIEPGTFKMGVPKENPDPKVPDERDVTGRVDEDEHEVKITKGFYMGKFEVTQAEYEAVMGKDKKNPSHFRGGKLPVERVSWQDAKEFCAELSKKEGQPYTLPTEAEWEYACRAGTNWTFHFGSVISEKDANYNCREAYPPLVGKKNPQAFLDKTTPVGSYPPNKWGLHDMHGNVWEWCEDWLSVAYYRNSPENDPQGPLSGVLRVVRGGSWFYEPKYCRAAYRGGFRPDTRSYNIGFRVVLRVSKDAPMAPKEKE